MDADTEALVRRLMVERGVSFKRALNQAIRAGADSRGRRRKAEAITRVHEMGAPRVDLDRALGFAGALEGDEIVRKLQVDK